ncbi:MAG: prepilin-type N-terminal cleavage/methylation domain-containing protein [Desulforhopalus sp.]|jgi:prepilin-type N-terminal cleavage/methylation domain-containing protein
MSVINKNTGFSLVEVLTVVAIIGIMSAIAMPPMFSWLSNKGLQSAGRDLYSNMRKAQSTAVKNNRNCAVSFDASGYMVYVDEDKSFSHDASEEQIIAQVLWSQYRNVQVDGVGWVNFDNTSGKPTIAIQPNLIPADNGGGIANGTVKLKNSNSRNLEVVVSISGNISLK